MKKIVITGYNGFVGFHLVNTLSKKYAIVGISNTPATTQKILKIRRDVRTINAKELPKDVYSIIHLAALTDVVYCQNNPTICYDINVKGTQNMLEIARKLDSKFIFVSTSHVYGIPKKLPINEEHPTKPTSMYSASKIAGEVICESYAKSYGMDLSITRLFSVYGPNSPPHLIISKIISQLLKNSTIRIGNLYPRRDFLYVADAVDAIKLVTRKSNKFNVYNVGTGKSHSILQICNIIKKISNKSPKIKSVTSQRRTNEINDIRADISKIKKLGWKPRIDIKEGLTMSLQNRT